MVYVMQDSNVSKPLGPHVVKTFNKFSGMVFERRDLPAVLDDLNDVAKKAGYETRICNKETAYDKLSHVLRRVSFEINEQPDGQLKIEPIFRIG